MRKNSTAPLNNTTPWHYLDTKRLDFRCENNSTPGRKYSVYIYIYIYILSDNNIYTMKQLAT